MHRTHTHPTRHPWGGENTHTNTTSVRVCVSVRSLLLFMSPTQDSHAPMHVISKKPHAGRPGRLAYPPATRKRGLVLAAGYKRSRAGWRRLHSGPQWQGKRIKQRKHFKLPWQTVAV